MTETHKNTQEKRQEKPPQAFPAPPQVFPFPQVRSGVGWILVPEGQAESVILQSHSLQVGLLTCG